MTNEGKSKGRGRPREFDRDVALNKAQALFHTHGYEGVGIAALADAMGISPPSLYAAFGNKVALFEEVLSRYSLASSLNKLLTKVEVDLATILTDLLHAAAVVYSRDPLLAGCLVLEGARSTDSDAAARARVRRDENIERLRALIARYYPDKANAMADYVNAVMSGLSADARAGNTSERLTAVADMASLAIKIMLEMQNVD